VGSTSAELVTAMQNVETTGEIFGVHGPKSSSFQGHI
jgi:hypothetical protein